MERNTQFIEEKVNVLLEKDPLIERRLLHLTLEQYTPNIDNILHGVELNEFYAIDVE